MSEQSQTPTGQFVPAASTLGATPGDAPPPPAAPPPSTTGGAAAVVQDRPEVAVGAAFAGGFVLALILKRLAS